MRIAVAIAVLVTAVALSPDGTAFAQSGRRGPHGPRPPTPPDVLIVSGGSLCGFNSACVSAGQGPFSVQRRGCLPLLKRSRSGSAFSARAGAHALPTGSTCLAVAPHPSSILVCSLPQKVRPFVGSRRLPWPLLTSLHPSHTVAVVVVWFAQTDVETSQGKSCLFPPVPAGFTPAALRMTIGHPHPLLGYPATEAFYPVSVRRARVLPYASFRSRLAADTLASASGSGHHGPQRTCTS